PLHLVEHPLQPVEEAVPAARVLAVAQLHAERLAIGAFERQLRLARPDPPARDQALRKGPDDPDQVERDFHFRSLACSGSLPQSTAPPCRMRTTGGRRTRPVTTPLPLRGTPRPGARTSTAR